jgi:predicted DsbA family dithiol-disulfide isomerase
VLTLQVLSETGVPAADLGKITDPAIQKKLGITATPALIVNNQVKVVGRVPTKEEIKKWIKDAVNKALNICKK